MAAVSRRATWNRCAGFASPLTKGMPPRNLRSVKWSRPRLQWTEILKRKAEIGAVAVDVADKMKEVEDRWWRLEECGVDGIDYDADE